jgi:hypothetical protein
MKTFVVAIFMVLLLAAAAFADIRPPPQPPRLRPLMRSGCRCPFPGLKKRARWW